MHLWQITADIEINDGVTFEDVIHFALETDNARAVSKMAEPMVSRSVGERLCLPPGGVAVTIKQITRHSEQKISWLNSVWNRLWGRKA